MAVTVKVALLPTLTPWLWGWPVMAGVVRTVSVATVLVAEPIIVGHNHPVTARLVGLRVGEIRKSRLVAPVILVPPMHSTGNS